MYKAAGHDRPGLGSEEFSDDDSLLLIKGAPDILLPYCNYTLCPDGEVVAIDDKLRSRISVLQEFWASRGQRVILLARKIIKSGSNEIPAGMGFEHALFGNTIMKVAETNLVFVGLVGIVVCSSLPFAYLGSPSGRHSRSRAYLSNCRDSILYGYRVRNR